MHTFTDNNSRVWTLSVNVATIKRVRALCGVDLAQIADFTEYDVTDSLLHKLSVDPVLLVDVLYAVCKPEAEAKNVTDENFGAAIMGDVIVSAINALLEEMVDFFPGSKRKILHQLLVLSRRFDKEIEQEIQNVLNETNAEADMSLLKNSSTNVPESAE